MAAAAHDRELRTAVEVVPGRLSWVSLTAAPQPHALRHCFCIDNDLVYWNFFLDFGAFCFFALWRGTSPSISSMAVPNSS